MEHSLFSEEDLKELTKCTKMFMNHVHWVQQTFNLIPERNHFGTCINYIDLQECRTEFCNELINTIPEWVYSQKKFKDVQNQLKHEGRSEINTIAKFTQIAFYKFRNRNDSKSTINGQFGELMLFNFLQSFFQAVPILRKMPITTTPNMERFGADAIHYTRKNNKHLFYLGEAKTYSSNYKFKTAIEEAVKSILKTYNNFREELDLYIYDDFIEAPLIKIVSDFKNGALEDSEVHLVSIITYCETNEINKHNEKQIKEDIVKIIEKRGESLDKAFFSQIDSSLHPRFNYIIFPIWELDKLISEFQKLIGK